MLLWNGVLWDLRIQNHVHQFDQFTDYCGGGFHPAGNEVHIFPLNISEFIFIYLHALNWHNLVSLH
jgi:hypothetical protein